VALGALPEADADDDALVAVLLEVPLGNGRAHRAVVEGEGGQGRDGCQDERYGSESSELVGHSQSPVSGNIARHHNGQVQPEPGLNIAVSMEALVEGATRRCG